MKPVNVIVHQSNSPFFKTPTEVEYSFTFFEKILYHALLAHSFEGKNYSTRLTLEFDNEFQMEMTVIMLLGAFPGLRMMVSQLAESVNNMPANERTSRHEEILADLNNIEWPEKSPT